MQEIHVVGAAIKDGDKVLAAQRSLTMSNPLKWEFVGGKVESGESHGEALKRELMEELGVNIKVLGHIATGTSIIRDKRIVLHVYEAEIIEGKPIAKEHAQLKWIRMSEIHKLDWAEADIPACERLKQR